MQLAGKPLYLQIKDALMEKIESRQYLPGQQLPTEYELAERFNVSRITSKRALEELEKDGVIRRRRGQGSFVTSTPLKTRGHKIISLILPHFNSDIWAMSYIKGAMEYVNEHGYYLSIHSSDSTDIGVVCGKLIQEGIGGIIYYPNYTNRSIGTLTALSMNHFPLVTIDKAFDGLPISAVISDNINGGYIATKHLIDLGHQHIAIVYSSQIGERTSARDRFVGYCQALSEAGIDIVPDYVVDDYFRAIQQAGDEGTDMTGLLNILRRLIRSNVTAIVAENDYEALTMYRLLNKIGIRIPDEVSLIGFDNSDLLLSSDIRMTTVNQHVQEIGRKAAELVISQIEGNLTTHQTITLPVELVTAQTTGPAPASAIPEFLPLQKSDTPTSPGI